MRTLLIIAITIAVGTVIPGSVTEARKAANEISLERTECLGSCPVYKLTIKSDGTVVYEGEKHVARVGKYETTITQWEFSRLETVLTRLGFWELGDKYESRHPDYPDAHVTDQSSAIVSAKTSRGTKSVVDYGRGGPIELWAIENTIDGLMANEKRWKKVRK